jgi:SpoIIAA-like
MSPAELRVGLHVIRREPPDLIVFRTEGEIGEEDARTIVDNLHDFAREHPNPFIIWDVSRLVRHHPAARKVSMTVKKHAQGRALVILGARFQTRVLVTLMVKAFALINKEAVTPMAFFDTEDEARAWFEERRRAR